MPFRYKKNAINSELQRAKKISSNLNQRQPELKHRVIKNTINKFNNGDKKRITPKWYFEERKAVAMNLPFSNKNEHFENDGLEEVKVL